VPSSYSERIQLHRVGKYVSKLITCFNNEELHDLYSSPNIIRVIQTRRIRWAGHVARLGIGEVHTGVWWANLKVTDHLEDLGIDGRILKWILKNKMGPCLDRHK